MPVVNDFPGLWEKIRGSAEQLAAAWNIPREIVFGYFNSTAHFPQSPAELEAWGNQVDPKYGVSRRDPNTGAWRPIMPTSRNPDPRLTEQDRGGFNHAITNAEDSDIQRFQQVDPSGNVFGGSWDNAYNQAHPELGGQTGFQTGPMGAVLSGRGGAAPGGPVRSASGDRISGTGPGMEFQSSTNPFAGTPQEAAWEAANPSGQPFGQATGATPQTGGGAVGGNVGANPATFGPAVDLANNAAQQEYLRKRLELDRDIANRLDEREKQRIALEAARDAWTKAYQTASLTGRFDGKPTVDAAGKRADTTGYYDEGGTGNGQAVLDAIQALRGNAQYQAADGATRRAMEAAAVQQATGGAVSGEQAAQAVDRLRSMTASTGGMSSAQLVEGVLNQVAPGRATLDREKEQNTTGIEALRLLSTLRGPENAFAYANTLQNLPPAIRASIQASMARVGMTPRNPAQAGVLGDVGAVPGGVTAPAGEPGSLMAQGWTGGPNGQENLRSPAAGAQSLPQGSVPVLHGGAPNGTAASVNRYLPAPLAASPAGAMGRLAVGAPAGTVDPSLSAGALGGPDRLPGAVGDIGPLVQRPDGTVGHDPTRAGTVRPDIAWNPAYNPPAPTGQPGTLGGNAPAFGPRTTPAGLTPGGQISPTDWNATNSYAKALALAGYEDQGQDKSAVLDAYRLSLPTAFGPRSGRQRAA